MNEIRNRNFFCFSLMKVSPLVLQETLYDGGIYNEAASVSGDTEGAINAAALVQHTDGISKSTGYSQVFLESYPVLQKLPEITSVSDGSKNTFFMMANDTTHSPCLLQEPDYVPAYNVDNTAYDFDMTRRYSFNGRVMDMTYEYQVTHYHVNMAAYIQLGQWFDYLREMGVYDNTRIILVSDHGRNINQFNVKCEGEDMELFMPLLMVKDFNATGFTVSDEFMTNADTPIIATSGLIDNPENPFTKNPLTSELKNGPQMVFLSDDIDLEKNNGNVFNPGKWFIFNGGSPKDPGNWTYLDEH